MSLRHMDRMAHIQLETTQSCSHMHTLTLLSQVNVLCQAIHKATRQKRLQPMYWDTEHSF